MASTKKGLVFGKIAVKKGFISKGDLKECIKRQKELAEEDEPPPSIKKILSEAGYVTDDQVEEIEEVRQKVSQKKEIPGYEIHEKLGEGATGAVYKATQLSLDRPVAIKVLYPSVIEDETYLDRFYREARTVAKLNHEGIIQGIDVGEENGLYYFVMEYVEGESLDEILDREGKINEEQAMDIGLQAARAMKHAAEHGLIHRDIKPENIMIDREGIAKLCDLGLAKKMGNEDSSVTQMGVSIGTPHYMSPEQAKGEELDIRTDIYALGASLYHAVTGEVPFDADAAASVMTKHVTEELVEPKEKNPDISSRFNSVITKMMKKNPDDRYQDPDKIIEDLERVREGKDPQHAEVHRERAQERREARSFDRGATSSDSIKLTNWKVLTAGGALLVGFMFFASYSFFPSNKSSSGTNNENVKNTSSQKTNEEQTKEKETNKNNQQTVGKDESDDQKTLVSQEDPDQEDGSKEKSKSLAELRRESFENIQEKAEQIEGDVEQVQQIHQETSALIKKVEDPQLKDQIDRFLAEFLEEHATRYFENNIGKELNSDDSITTVLDTFESLDQFPGIFESTDIWEKVKKEQQKAKDRISVYVGEMKRQLSSYVENREFEEAEEVVRKMEELMSRSNLSNMVDWEQVRITYLSERSTFEREQLNESEQLLKEFRKNFQQHYRLSNKSIFQVSDKRANKMVKWYAENVSIDAVRREIERYREDVKLLSLYRKQLQQKLKDRIQRNQPIEFAGQKGKLVDMNGHLLLVQMRNTRMEKPLGELEVEQRISFANWKNSQLDVEEKFTFGLVAYLANDLDSANKWLVKAEQSGMNRSSYYLSRIRLQKKPPREQKANELIDSLRRASSAGLNFAMGRIIFDLQFYQDTKTYEQNKAFVEEMRNQLEYDPSSYIKGVSSKSLSKRVKRQITMLKDWYQAEVGRGAGKETIYLTYDFSNKKQIDDWSVSNPERLSVSTGTNSSHLSVSGKGYVLHDLQFAGRAGVEARISMQENLGDVGALMMWSNNRGYRGIYNWNPLGRSSNLSQASANVLQFLRLPGDKENPDYTQTVLQTISREGQDSLTGKRLGRLGMYLEKKNLRLTFDGQTLVSARDDRFQRGKSGFFFESEKDSKVMEVTLSGRLDPEWFDAELKKRGISKDEILQEQEDSEPAEGGVSGDLERSDVPKTNVAFAVNLGGQSTDAGGFSFQSDPFNGNDKDAYYGQESSGNPDPAAKYSAVYKTQRWGSEMWYSLPVAKGGYEVTLYFFENNWEQSGKRKFDVFLEKQRVLKSFDIFKESGGKDQGVTKTFDQIWVGDGALDIKLEGLSESDDKNATIAGFLVRRTRVPEKTSSNQDQNESQQNRSSSETKSGSGSSSTEETSEQENNEKSSSNGTSRNPNEENNLKQGDSPLTFQDVGKGEVAFAINIGNGTLSRSGLRFQEDPYQKDEKESLKGKKSTNYRGSQPDTLDKILRSNRWGTDMSFALPVSNGEYQVKLFFVENWWNKIGKRVFDVFLQGNRVLHNLDLFRETGGRHKKLVKTFKNVTVKNKQLLLELKASSDHAICSGIVVRKTGSQ